MTIPVTQAQLAFKCDTCKRYIKLPRNKRGFETLQHCVITEGCLGTMYPVKVLTEENKASTIPPDVAGLQNWAPRKIFYKHTQTVPKLVWNVVHNLGVKPSVQIWVERQELDGSVALVEKLPEAIVVINPNQVNVIFENEEIGIAECISSSSGFEFDATPVVDTSVVYQQITTDNELTIATLNSVSELTLEIVYISLGVPFQVVYVNVDNQPSINTPWVGTNKVYINGRTYTVRSFDFREHAFANSTFNANVIADGSPFYFSSFSTNFGQNYILLSDPPYTSTIDKNSNQYVDIAAINRVTPQTLYTGGELVIDNTLIKNAYPPIQSVD